MATPTYTYGYAPITVPIDQVRLWIRDTTLYFDADKNAMVMQFADQEILAYINECGSLYEAAASCCEALASQYAGKHQYNKSIGNVKISENYQKQHLNYLEIANNIRKRHSSYQTLSPSFAPAALQSTGTNGQIPETTDFYTGQFDDQNSTDGFNSITGF